MHFGAHPLEHSVGSGGAMIEATGSTIGADGAKHLDRARAIVGMDDLENEPVLHPARQLVSQHVDGALADEICVEHDGVSSPYDPPGISHLRFHDGTPIPTEQQLDERTAPATWRRFFSQVEITGFL